MFSKIIKKNRLTCQILIICLILFFNISIAQADTVSGAEALQKGLQTTAASGKLSTDTDLPTMVGSAVNYFFGLLGVVFLTVVLIGGYLWMTAGGNEEKVGKAKGWIINGINGIIVAFLAYALVYVILAALQQATTGG